MKFKTKKTIRKRIVKITKNKKLIGLCLSTRHLARKKSKRALTSASKNRALSKPDTKKLKKILGV